MSTENTQQDVAGLTGAATAMIAGAAESLGQVFGVSVDLALASIHDDPVPAEQDGLRFLAEFGGVASGQSWVVLATTDAAAIVKASPQGAGLADDDVLGESGMSALSEAIDVIVAGAATAISNDLGDLVDISPPSLSSGAEASAGSLTAVFTGEAAGKPGFEVSWEFDSSVATALGTRWLATRDEPVAAAPAAAEPVTAPVTAPAATPPPPPAAASPIPAAPAVGGGVINTVELDVAVELGNVAVTIGELLRMGEGSVVTLAQAVGDKVTMLANGTPVASGEVVVVDGTLGFRVADLITEPRGA